jgi:hypothetical protein
MPRKIKAKQPNEATDVARLVAFLRDKMHDEHAIFAIREHLLQVHKHMSAILSEADAAMLASTLADVMAAQPQHVRLQISVCCFIRELTGTRVSSLEKFGANTVIPAIVNAMKNHADNADLQDSAAEALAQLVMDFDKADTDRAYIPPQETIDSIMQACLSALKRHDTHMSIQAQALTVMQDIFQHSSASHQLLMEGGAVGVIVRGMRAFRDCVMLQLHGCKVLAYLITSTSNDAYKQVFWKEGALNMFFEEMNLSLLVNETGQTSFKEHCKAVSYNQRIYPTSILAQGFWSMILMYQNESQQHEERGLSVVPQACARYLDNVNLQKLGMEAMFRALQNCPKNCAHVGREGIRAALCAMAVHDKVEGVQAFGTMILVNMVECSSTNSRVIVEDDGLRIVMRNLGMHAPACVQANALLLLSFMTVAPDLRLYEELINAGCVRAICDIVLRHKRVSSQQPQDSALESNAINSAALVLRLISSGNMLNQTMRSRMMKEGAIDAAMHVMSIDKHASAQMRGCEIIASLFYEHDENIMAAGLSVLPALANAILAYQDDMPVHEQACLSLFFVGECMFNTGQRDAYQQTMRECGGLRALIQCIKLYAHPDGIFTEGHQDHVFAYACITLYYAAMHHPRNTEYCKNNGGREAYLAAFNHHKGNKTYEYHLRHARDVFMGESCSREEVFCRQNTRIFGGPNLQRASTDCTAHGAPRTSASTSKQPASSQAMSRSTAHVERVCLSQDVCVACGKTAQDSGMAKLLKCSACTIAPMYCSAACQRACWPQHKAQCKANKRKDTK